MNKKERLLFAIGEVDEKYVKEAEFKVKISSIVKVAVAAVVVIALSLYLFIPFGPVTSDLSSYESSSYFPLIEEIEAYNLTFRQPRYKNNFMWLADEIDDLFGFFVGKGGAMAPDMNGGSAGAPGMEGNGNYMESTDNQVDGVIESDLMKMTDKYIFRIGDKMSGYTEQLGKYDQYTVVLRVYSVDKENSDLVAEFEVPKFPDQQYYTDMEMYLSHDGNTVTLMSNYHDSTGKVNVGISSIDVSDINSISLKGRISVQGSINTSRMVDGKLLLVTNYRFTRNNVDYSDPKTFVPTIDFGNGPEPIRFDDIIYPENVDDTDYSVVALMDAENLSLLGANALLNFTNEVYVSAENIYIGREYVHKVEEEKTLSASNMSDIAVFGYSGNKLENKGIITVRGWTEDQYSFDELDGYLRVVTSTRETKQTTNGNNVSLMPVSTNASLYIFNLADNSLAYKVENFAPEGEEATAVRFDGDKCYVCTAFVVTFTDPVYFFDLSDYENITYTDTGIIDGYSDHLINYGEGLALGIGRENWQNGKVEIYADRIEGVVSIHEYEVNGNYSLDYKSYLVNREENLFGFGVDHFYEYDSQSGKGRIYQRYVLIKFSAENMTVYTFDIESMRADTVRAAYIDGYLYITTQTELVVEKLD